MITDSLVLVENTISHTFVKVSQNGRDSVRTQTIPACVASENRVMEIRHTMDPKKTKPYRHLAAFTRTIVDANGLPLRKLTTHVVTTHDAACTEAELRENEELVAAFLSSDSNCQLWHLGGS